MISQSFPMKLTRPCPEIAVLILNRPECGNALSEEVLIQLEAALDEIRDDQSVRVLQIQGTGRHFCSGIDLRESLESFEKAANMFGRVTKILVKLRQLPAIILTLAHGGTFGGGVALAASSDLTVAADDLQLGCPEVLRGFDPVLLFPLFRRKLSDSALRQLLLTGLPIDADRAKEIGLVQYVCEKENAAEFLEELAQKIRWAEPQAVRNAKLMLAAHEIRHYGITLEEEWNLSLQAHLESWKTTAAQERIREFLR